MNDHPTDQPSGQEALPPAADSTIHTTMSAVDLDKEQTEMSSEPTRDLQALESGTEPTPPAPLATVQASRFIVPAQSKSHKVLIIGGVVVGLLAVIGVAFAVYFYVLRTPDSDYQAAIEPITTLTDNIREAKNVAGLLEYSEDETKFTDSTLKELDDTQKSLDDYQAALTQLGMVSVIKKDTVVREAFDANKATFTNYYSVINDQIESAKIYVTVGIKYKEALKGLSKIETVTDYDAAIKDTTRYLSDHPTVPAKDFNSKVYVPFRTIAQESFVSTRNYLDAIIKQDESEYTSAAQELADENTKMDAVTAAAKSFKATLPQNPTKALGDLKQTILNRKAVFWR